LQSSKKFSSDKNSTKIDTKKLEDFRSKSQTMISIDMNSPTANLQNYLKSTRMNKLHGKSKDMSFNKTKITSGFFNQESGIFEQNKSIVNFNQKSRLMDHDLKSQVEQEPLSPEKKQSILGRFLTGKNKLGMNQLRNEVNGLQNEKEDAILTVQEQKRKVINDNEELSIINMQN